MAHQANTTNFLLQDMTGELIKPIHFFGLLVGNSPTARGTFASADIGYNNRNELHRCA